MDHEEIPEALGADVHGLLGTALADIDFDADVVPGVLAGYRRHVRVRRWQAAGGVLAAVTIAAAGVGALHSWAVGEPAPPAAVYPTGDFANAGCTQHWGTLPDSLLRMVPDPPGRRVKDREFCQALTDAVLAGAPLGSTLTPKPLAPDLKNDPHIDGARYAQYEALLYSGKAGDELVPTGYMDMFTAGYAEADRLAKHPEDPLNGADGVQYSFSTPLGTTDLDIQVESLPHGSPTPLPETECRDIAPTDQCTAVAAGTWRGTVVVTAPDVGGRQLAVANLGDGKGDVFRLISRGYDTANWRSLPAAASDAKSRFWNGTRWVADDVWTNLRTGKRVTSVGVPPSTTLSLQQWVALIQTPAFAGFLDHAVPAYQGWSR